MLLIITSAAISKNFLFKLTINLILCYAAFANNSLVAILI